MIGMDESLVIEQYFKISDLQKKQFTELASLYKEWNDKINVVSRKDIDNIVTRHILHCLAIAKFTKFASGTKVLDLGTGGGLPGIPLAILFPEVEFLLVDGTGKKIKVVNDIIEQLGIQNAKGQHIRAEYLKEQFDFVVSRAVAKIDQLKLWSFPLISEAQKSIMPNGLICLKGGNLREELSALSRKDYYEKIAITQYFEDPYFEEKFLIYLQR